LIPLILHFEIMGVNFQLAGEFFLWIALFFTVWSGWDYIYGYVRQTGLA
jgi:CDP-diacylglycerol--glycerol-3-phosphate 3-phosphatidyltransferase